MKNSNNLKHRNKIVFEYLGLKKTDKVLSVGCKYGTFELLILPKIKSLVAFDILRDLIKKNNQELRDNPKIKFEYGDISKKTKYKSGFFDKVIFLEVIEHLPRGTELKALKEIYRLLKKDGILVLPTPNSHWYSNLTDFARVIADHRHYKIETIENLCKQAGFKIKKKTIVGGFCSTTWISLRMILRIFRLYKLVKFIDQKIMEDIKEKEYSQKGFLNIFLKCQK